MVFVVVQEPSGDLPECGDRIRKRVHANIVSLEGFDEAARGWPREFSVWISALRGRDVLDGISAQAGPPRPAWRQAGDLRMTLSKRWTTRGIVLPKGGST